MSKLTRWCWALVVLLPSWALADSTQGGNPLNFTPPPTDYSIAYLGNIFGVVDGVLYGTGSQIMGTVFGILNSAVLALGGVVLLYTLVVSTLNTAHEGEFMGKKYSSIWIPVRTVLGVALLVPKASGYCLMQVFVMWMVVQGVGAADKVWGAALDYLGRGGVLIQVTAGSGLSLDAGSLIKGADTGNSGNDVMAGQAANAYKLLQMQVCMQSLQEGLKNMRESARKIGRCDGSSNFYCKPVPDLGGEINFVYNASKNTQSIPVPYTLDQEYSRFNGLCGSIEWDNLNTKALGKNIGLDVDAAAVQTAARALPIAIQQMWIEMGSTASTIIRNYYQREADTRQTLGMVGPDGLSWQAVTGNKPPLMSGTEITDATAAYLGIMSPTLRAISGSVKENTDFIEEAKRKGWIMAGTYFFSLAALNTAAEGYRNPEIGFRAKYSVNGPADITSRINDNYLIAKIVPDMERLLGNTLQASNPLGSHAGKCSIKITSDNVQHISSYICHALKLKKIGQPPSQPPDFITDFAMTFDTVPPLPNKSFKGGFMNIPGTVTTMFYKVARLIINILLKIFNVYLFAMMELIWKPIVFLTMAVFTGGIELALQNPGNPIVAMMMMGTNMINSGIGAWILVMLIMTALSAVPGVGQAGITLMMFIGPFLFAWISVMVVGGATLAFYIPMLPYMIFLFASVGWFISVIMAMAAAPLMVLALMYPEGHETFGNAQQGMMMLVNIFLKPVMLIIGFIVGIILCYVAVWLLNAGFQTLIDAMLKGSAMDTLSNPLKNIASGLGNPNIQPTKIHGFAAIIGMVMMMVIYITLYSSLVKMCIEMPINKLMDELGSYYGGQSDRVTGEATKNAQAVEGSVERAAGKLDQARKSVKLPHGGGGGGKGAASAGGGLTTPKSPGGGGGASLQSGPQPPKGKFGKTALKSPAGGAAATGAAAGVGGAGAGDGQPK